MDIPSFLEACMVVSFGISWPVSIVKSIRSKSTKGKSPVFLCLIFFGYICGLASKLASRSITYVVVFYALNLLMVGTDLALYARNRRLEQKKEESV